MSAVSSSLRYDIKSADLPFVALLLKTDKLSELEQDLRQQFAETPDFFDNDPLLIDFSHLPEGDASGALDFGALLSLLKQHRLCPMAIKGASAERMAAARAAGLVDASDARIRKQVDMVNLQPAPAVVPVSEGAMVIDRPLRSGQQVYAKGTDLIVLAMVNPGAEVIADGHIHVYSTLRGKAIAGARGMTSARIFAQAMEPELISIAGVYRTSENALPREIWGQAAHVSLRSGNEGDKLMIVPLKA